MTAILVTIMGLLLPIVASAHELWSVNQHAANLPPRPEIFTEPSALGVYLFAATLIILVILVGTRSWYKRSPLVQKLEKRMIFPFHAKQILAAMIGVNLVWSAIGNTLFAPNLPFPPDLSGEIVKWLAVATGFGLIFFEYFLFECSLSLFALFICLTIFAGPAAMMQQLFFAGAALFLALTAPRTWLSRPVSLLNRQRAYAVFRVFLGITFIALASVKWLYPELGLQILHDFPAINFMTPFGMDDGTFMFCTALVETLCGLAFVLNLYVRWFGMILVPIFTLTAFTTGQKEVIGHLPIQAALAVFVLYGHTYIPKYKTHLEVHGKTSQAFDTLPI